jgi:hypothetical protein
MAALPSLAASLDGESLSESPFSFFTVRCENPLRRRRIFIKL